MTKKALLLLAVSLLLMGGVGATAFVYFGIYNIAATEQHTAPVYWLLENAMLRSVKVRSESLQVPNLQDDQLVRRGFVLYQNECVRCHGAPGVAPEEFALGMMPVPANLVQTAREWKPQSLFWVIKHGVKMTGMPGWKYRVADSQIWAIVAFVERLPSLSPKAYQTMVAAGVPDPALGTAEQPTPGTRLGNAQQLQGDPDRGKQAMQQYACGSCHVIPGVVGANKQVGPPLTGMNKRKYIAGILPNTYANMVKWLQAPQQIAPLTAMPDLNVKERDARDMAAYLQQLTELP